MRSKKEFHKRRTFYDFKFDKISESCPVCESNSIYLWDKYNDFTFFACRECSHVFLNPMLSDSSINNLYKGGVKRWTNIKEYEDSRENYFNYFIDELKKSYKKEKVTILDYGAGIGSFLKKVKKLKWEEVGLELSNSDIKIARSRKLNVNNINHFQKIKDNSIDVCTMFDVLEHLKSPKPILANIHRSLKPGGMLIIDTGNVGGLPYYFAKGKNPFVEHEGHIMLYTLKSITRLLSDSGFRVFRISSEKDIKSNRKISIFERVVRKFRSNPNMFIYSYVVK